MLDGRLCWVSQVKIQRCQRWCRWSRAPSGSALIQWLTKSGSAAPIRLAWT